MSKQPTEAELQAAADAKKAADEKLAADKLAADKAASEKAALEKAAAGLIKVKKDDETLDIHPSTLASHQAAGWKLVD